MVTAKLQKTIANIPDKPGVYILKDAEGKVLYIGKARSFKKRLRSYFNQPQSLKIQIMLSKVFDIEYIITESETQARFKEARLIKENLPPYNTALRDDKSFPLACISDEQFPVVWVARRTNKRVKNLAYCYFGPYTNAGLLRDALKSIRHIFGFRTCFKMPRKVCLYYRLKLCPAPCIGKIGIKKYREIIRDIILFLEGKHDDLIGELTIKMRRLANDKRFEEAAEVRNQIRALSILAQYQPFAVGNKPPKGLSFFSDSYRESTELKDILGINVRPQRIEAFDVSNISGTSACASMVYFYEGKPDKRNYRRFRIKTVLGIDDYGMIEEAVSRRYRRIIEEKLPLPDLIIIDGGRGQLNTVMRRLQNLGLKIPVISIAKQQEEIYIPSREKPIRLNPDSLALRLIQRVRNEAHRFALAYHHILRRKKIIGR